MGHAIIVHHNLIRMVIMACQMIIELFAYEPSLLTTVKMLIQEPDETLMSTLALDQPRNVMYHIKRVRPFVALCPPIVWTRPSPAGIPCLHEPGFRVEDSKGAVHRTRVEKHLFVGLVEQAGQHGDRKVVVWKNV